MVPQPKAARGQVDWADVRTRLEAATRALGASAVTSPERARQVLEERARRLARPAATDVADLVELLFFELANEVYGVESRSVMAVFRLVDLTPLPGATAPTFGVTTWRGELLTILDLRRVLGISVASLNDLTTVVVLGEARPAFGILVDNVRNLASIPRSSVRKPPDGVAGNREFIRGITGDAAVVLDAGTLLRRYQGKP